VLRTIFVRFVGALGGLVRRKPRVGVRVQDHSLSDDGRARLARALNRGQSAVKGTLRSPQSA
jgi:hypothetical protein